MSELIVAIVIVALLVGLAFGSANSVLARSRSTMSASNLRSLSHSTLAYVTDHNGNFPFKRLYGGFYGCSELWKELMPYINSPRKALVDPGDRRPVPINTPDILDMRCSYAGNALLMGGRYGEQAPTNARQGVLSIRQVTGKYSRIVLLFESDVAPQEGAKNNAIVGRGVGAMWFNSTESDLPSQRYNGGSNITFLDGSGRWIKTSLAPDSYVRHHDDATFSPFFEDEQAP